MSYPTKIAYPSPPPTTNSLTSHQRSQLLRSTQKLGRILGTTPALIEESEPMPSMLPLNLQRLAVPLHIQLSSVYSDDDALGGYPSSDTLVSSGSERGSPTSLKRNSSLSSPFDTPKPAYANESWAKVTAPSSGLPPTGGLPSSRTIPQSPTGHPPPYSQEPPHNHTSFTIRPIPASQRHAPAPPPAFVLPTQTSMRRQKMDKLRRTLGDGVPLDMVFPDEETHPVPMLHSNSSSSSDSEEDFLSHARPHRIRAARDSLLVPHPQSLRQQRVPGAPQAKLSIIAERPEPSPPSPAYRGSTESERYQGDTEGEFAPRHRRGSRLYDGSERRVKRVPVPAA
ncbi:hypothetical protein B0H14DRAFT_3664114 [Mycena olivaceomarginata]|nr:hypothetical protein B0H14DRAFT_3664114 [Mycena olivaceomarginata]